MGIKKRNFKSPKFLVTSRCKNNNAKPVGALKNDRQFFFPFF